MLSQLKRNMSRSPIDRLLKNAEIAEKRLAEVRSKLGDVKRCKIDEHVKRIKEANKALAAQVENAKAELIRLETANNKKQYPLPQKASVPSDAACKSEDTTAHSEKPLVVKNPAKKIKEKPESANDATIIDVRKLDFRIGKIVDINKHPDADSLYVEKIDCGEDKPRTVVSGLVNHVPIEEMQNKIVVILANLKPVKMRGVTSEAMVMCASSPEKVEVLVPPSGAVPGDLVECEGYPREPEAVLNPKKKIFEACAPDLLTNNDKIACYKGSPLMIPGKGVIMAPTLKGVNVK